MHAGTSENIASIFYTGRLRGYF